MVVLPFRLTLLSINESENIYRLSLISSSRSPVYGHQKPLNVNELHSIQPIRQTGRRAWGGPVLSTSRKPSPALHPIVRL